MIGTGIASVRTPDSEHSRDPDAFSPAIITMTTIGYEEMVPVGNWCNLVVAA